MTGTSIRLTPTSQTLRELYALSGNQCANPKCATVLINANGTLVAEVCHIKAESVGGPRYDAKLTAEQRRSTSNLILLCSTCHALVDAEPKNFTVATLRGWKKKREDRFVAVGDTLRQRLTSEISDESTISDLKNPRSLAALSSYLGNRRIAHMIDEDSPKHVMNFAKNLRHLSSPDRALVLAIVEKAISLKGSQESEYGLSVHPDDLKTIIVDNKRLSDYKIGRLGRTLERNGFGSLDCDEEPELRIATLHEGITWSLIHRFLARRGNSLRHLICDLEFSLLD